MADLDSPDRGVLEDAAARRFLLALSGLLDAERGRARSGQVTEGWAPGHTAAIDAYFAPALAFIDTVLARRSPAQTPTPSPMQPLASAPTGARRPIYTPLRTYALARAGLAPDGALAAARSLDTPASAVGVWWGLVRTALGDASPTFARLLASQRPNGEFFDASPYDSPDLHWYDELVVLHAVTTFAASLAAGPDRAAALAAVHRAAAFHTAETQPDHATTQPWALHAFALDTAHRPLADLLLHGALSQNAGRLDAISQVLLADAVDSLSLLLPSD